MHTISTVLVHEVSSLFAFSSCHPCRTMASMQECTSSSSSTVMLILEAEDIEGATLEEPLETKTIPQLRWWLLCHGIEPTASEKKNNFNQKVWVV